MVCMGLPTTITGFAGKRLMEMPVDRFLANKENGLPLPAGVGERKTGPADGTGWRTIS